MYFCFPLSMFIYSYLNDLYCKLWRIIRIVLNKPIFWLKWIKIIIEMGWNFCSKISLVKLYLYSDFWSLDGMWKEMAAPQNVSEQIDNNTNSNASVEFYFCRNQLNCTGVQRPSINQVCDGIEDDKFLYLNYLYNRERCIQTPPRQRSTVPKPVCHFDWPSTNGDWCKL